MMTNPFVLLLIGVAVLLCAWYILERFSPDPLLTKICQIIIFVLAILLVIRTLLPVFGVHI